MKTKDKTPRYVTSFKAPPDYIPEVPPDTSGTEVGKKPFVIRKRRENNQTEESRVSA